MQTRFISQIQPTIANYGAAYLGFRHLGIAKNDNKLVIWIADIGKIGMEAQNERGVTDCARAKGA